MLLFAQETECKDTFKCSFDKRKIVYVACFWGGFAYESEKEIQNTFCPYLYWALQSAEEGREGKKEGVLLEEDHIFLFRVTTAAGCHRLGIQLSFFCISPPESRRNGCKKKTDVPRLLWIAFHRG